MPRRREPNEKKPAEQESAKEAPEDAEDRNVNSDARWAEGTWGFDYKAPAYKAESGVGPCMTIGN